MLSQYLETGTAIRTQVPVVAENLLPLMNNKETTDKSYKVYSSYPLVTGYGKMVLAEFDYQGNFTPDPKLKQFLVSKMLKNTEGFGCLKNMEYHIYTGKKC